MARRNFLPIRERVDGRTVAYYKLECSSCDDDPPPIPCTAETAWPNQMVMKVARNKGWRIGKKDGEDVCPTCTRKARRANLRLVDDIEQEPDVKLAAFPTADMPQPITIPMPTRSPSISDTLVILAKLEETFDPDKGYANGTTDATLARDLGVPRVWVVEVRQGKYGSAGTNPEITDLIARAAMIQEQFLKLAEENATLASQIKANGATIAAIGAEAARIDRQIQDIVKTIR